MEDEIDESQSNQFKSVFYSLGKAGGGGAGAEFDEFDGEGRLPLENDQFDWLSAII